MPQKDTNYLFWFLKKSKKHLKKKFREYSDTKKVNYIYSVIPNLKHKLLS